MIKNQVRPAMTPEARDILNSIHETVGAETRSDSIVEFMDKHTEIGAGLCAKRQEVAKLEKEVDFLRENKTSPNNVFNRNMANSNYENAMSTRLKGEVLSMTDKLTAEKSKRKGWMIYSAIVAVYAIGISVYCLIGG